MRRGKIRRLFPGGNTCKGFYMFFDHIPLPGCKRVFIMKGGPGVGKSTLMRKMADTIIKQGYNMEYFQCTADNSSIDGIQFPEIGVVLIDGTAPHMVDPKMPGVKDEIINLGDYWDEKGISTRKDEIQKLMFRNKRCYKTAYNRLKEAKIINDELEGYYTECSDFKGINRLTHELMKQVFEGAKPNYDETPLARHLFAWAISPDGPVQYLDTTIGDVERIFLLEGPPGTGKTTIIEKVAARAFETGINAEVFHSGFDPSRIDLVVLGDLKTAVLNHTGILKIDVSRLSNIKHIKIYDLGDFLNYKALEYYSDDIAMAKGRYIKVIDAAVDQLHKTKEIHDELEKCYVPYMDFDMLGKKRDSLIEKMLSYAK